jgi:site-specific recombinase XerD
MQIFKNYLKSEHYKTRTISEHCLNVERFINWFGSTDQQELAQLSVAQLVEYINVLQAKELAAETINLQLRSIRKYYEYLESEGYIIPKIENVKVKGVTKKVVIDPLEYSDLEQLYKDYSAYKKEQIEQLKESNLIRASKTCSKTALKRKVMLGFMVFQGLHSGELKRLEINHINNEDVTVYIMGSGKSKARQLLLQPLQMQALFMYLGSSTNDQMQLLSGNLNNQTYDLFEELKGLNQKVQNGLHIRASVILHWLQLHGKRQTQYMIGHKWISSTEHYELQNLEELTNLLDEHHPLVS